jgi:hypothetical protein
MNSSLKKAGTLSQPPLQLCLSRCGFVAAGEQEERSLESYQQAADDAGFRFVTRVRKAMQAYKAKLWALLLP